MLVKPAPGRAIRDPGTMQLVPDTGQEIDPTNLFWARVLGDKDVVELSEEEAAAYEAALNGERTAEDPAPAEPPVPAEPAPAEPAPAEAAPPTPPETPAPSGPAASTATQGADA